MIQVPLFLIGAKGLLAAEFLRHCDGHPGIGEVHVFSRRAHADLREFHPQLGQALRVRDLGELPEAIAQALAAGPAVLIFATPHGVSGKLLPQYEKRWEQDAVSLDGLYILDLSEDHRLLAPRAQEDPVNTWKYGLPELHPLPEGTRRVAAAGCFATAMQLAVLPLERAGMLDASQPLILQGVTASSGSGSRPSAGTHHPYRNSNFVPYALGGHRHERELGHRRNFEVAPKVCFLPCSAPLGRGLYLTAQLSLLAGADLAALTLAYENSFRAQHFVELMPEQAPQLRAVIGSNRVCIGWTLRAGMAQVYVALDNTIKGGAGQGLQCLNLMLGLPEHTSLPLAGLGY